MAGFKKSGYYPLNVMAGFKKSGSYPLNVMAGFKKSGYYPLNVMAGFKKSGSYPLNVMAGFKKSGYYPLNVMAGFKKSGSYPLNVMAGFKKSGYYPLNVMAGFKKSGSYPLNVMAGFKKSGSYPLNVMAGFKKSGYYPLNVMAGFKKSGSYPLNVMAGFKKSGYYPLNVMAGFKKSGSYPLNPGAVHDRQLMPSKAFHPLPESQLSGNSGDSPTSPDSFGGSVSDASANSSCPPPFTAKQEDQYRRQYKEGYDLPDLAYITWLAVRHPEITSPPRSTVTNLSGSCPEHSSEPKSSSDVSDTLSQILMFPKPRLSRKRKSALTSKAVTITDCEVLAEIKKKKEEKTKKEAEKEAWKVKREQKKKEREADKAARKNEVWKRKEAREAAKEAIKVKGHTKDRGNIEKAIEKLTLSEQSDSESDAQCSKCGLTFQDGSNSVWVCCDGSVADSGGGKGGANVPPFGGE